MVQKSAFFILALLASALAQDPISMITSMAGGGANPMGAIAGMATGLGAAGMMSQFASGNLDGPIQAFISRLPANVQSSPPVQRFISTVLPQIRRLAQMVMSSGAGGGNPMAALSSMASGAGGGNPMAALSSMASGAGGGNPMSALSSMASGAGGANPISAISSMASGAGGANPMAALSSAGSGSNPLGSIMSAASS